MDPYREHILDHYQNPRNRGSLRDPTFSVDEDNPVCGDRLHLDVILRDGTIGEIAFSGEGCAISLAAASILTEETKGKAIAAVKRFSDNDMLQALGIELSPTRLKCGLLAVSGLRRGLQ